MERTKITRQQFVDNLAGHLDRIDGIRCEIVDLVNIFKEDNPNDTYDEVSDIDGIGRKIDNAILNFVWIIDRLNDVKGIVGLETYNKSLAKKVRKALGYTY